MRVREDVGGGGRLQMEWNKCTYSYHLLERLNASRNVQPRHFLIELFRSQIWKRCAVKKHKQHQPVMAELK